MNKEELKDLILTARGQKKADIVIKNINIVDVLSGNIFKGDIAISGKHIAGCGSYDGEKIIDGLGKYAIPGLIDSHIHIESSYICPEELSKMIVPHGTTTIITDPHEITNVKGLEGYKYMTRAAKRCALDIINNIPSCVPATPFENSGANLDAKELEKIIDDENALGLAELMNYVGVINADDNVLDKILLAKKYNKIIDGHSPGLLGKDLNAYASVGILSDHEVTNIDELKEKIRSGIYIALREGSACHNLTNLIKYITPEMSRRCVLCSDDRQTFEIIEKGHIDGLMKICVNSGMDPICAIRMATLNVKECWDIKDKGVIAPGYLADIVIMDNLKDFNCLMTIKSGNIVAEKGMYLLDVEREDISPVRGSIVLTDFNINKLKMNLKSNRLNIISIIPGEIVTKKEVVDVELKDGDFVFNKDKDLAKICVIERHHNTGNVACAILKGFGIKSGAIAISIAHDSHNIITVGVSNEEIYAAVMALKEQEGGIVLVNEGKVIASLPMPIAGLMSDKDGYYVSYKLSEIHQKAHNVLGVSSDVDPITTLSFMALPVIPEIKITDKGLFDVNSFCFIKNEYKS